MVIALIVTPEGFPLTYEVLSGNTSDKTTLKDFLQKIETQYGKARLGFMADVGLGYLTLDRTSHSLSGGEAQRIRLATQVGSGLVGVCYILDEPTTGLHFADIHNLLNVLQRLVDMGHTVIVIEHNLDVIKTADYIIDLGPEGGQAGGEVVVAGSPEQIIQNPDSYTARYLRDKLEGKSRD